MALSLTGGRCRDRYYLPLQLLAILVMTARWLYATFPATMQAHGITEELAKEIGTPLLVK